MFRPPYREWARSSRHFPRELLIIVAGILIALAVDGMADRYEERKLAREAVANMQGEIADNLGDLDGARRSYPRMLQSLEENLAAMEMLQKGESPKAFSRRIPFSTVALTDSSLATAEAPGALRHLDYGEARRFADLFTVQREYLRQQARLVDHWVATTPVGEEDLFALSGPQLAERAAELKISLRYLSVVRSGANNLSEMYEGRLKSSR